MNPDPLASVALDCAGTGSPARYLPVRIPWAMGEKTIWVIPSFSHRGVTSDSITRQIMLYCGWLDTIRSKPISAAIWTAAAISSVRHSETPTYSTLPWRTRSSKARRVSASGASVVVAVCLVEVQVVGLEPAQRAVHRLQDVLAGQAAVLGPCPGWPVDLRADLQGFTAGPVQRAAEHFLGPGPGVDVGRVERGDALIQGRRDTRPGGVFLDLGAVRDPVPVGDLTDFEATAEKAGDIP